VKNSQDREKYH